MINKFRLTFILLLLVSAPLLAQEVNSGLVINSNPPGASVLLDGALSIDGLTPMRFPSELQGKYKLTLKQFGYETYRKTLFLQPDKPMELNLDLKPKTKFKATLRSIIIPGWGQMYGGQTTKGVMLTMLAIGATGFYFIADNKYNNRLDDYQSIQTAYNTAATDSEKIQIYSLLATAKKNAYDAEGRRQIAIGTVAAVWGLGLIDILFFFPRERGNTAVNSLTIKPDTENGGAQLVLSHRF